MWLILSYYLLSSMFYLGCSRPGWAALWAVLSWLLHMVAMPLCPALSDMASLLHTPPTWQLFSPLMCRTQTLSTLLRETTSAPRCTDPVFDWIELGFTTGLHSHVSAVFSMALFRKQLLTASDQMSTNSYAKQKMLFLFR